MRPDQNGILRGALPAPAAAADDSEDLFGEFEIMEKMDVWAAEGRPWESVRAELADLLGLPPFESLAEAAESAPET